MSGTVEQWLEFARNDLRAAELLLEDEIYYLVCFHGQQCTEKTLKAILVLNGVTPPKIHSINKLLTLLPPEWADRFNDDLPLFDDFYIPTRYPDALPGSLPEGLPSKAEAEKALSMARETFQEVQRHLNTAQNADDDAQEPLSF